MTVRPRGPYTLKGALVSVPADGRGPQVIAFQYNPSTLRRALQPSTVGGEADDRSLSVRFKGAAVETITADVEIDASDALERGDPVALASGILPSLAALELLAYPSVSQVAQLQQQLAGGTIEIVPLTAPRTLFVWGARRVLPVRIQALSVTEEAFDSNLNPIRATVTLSLRVLSYSDLDSSTRDYHQFVVYQQSLEALAASARSGNPQADTGVSPGSL